MEQHLGAELPALERAGAEVLHDHVAHAHQLEEELAPARAAHVERQAALVAVGDHGARAGARPRVRRPAGGRQLDHDHVRAEVAEDGRGGGAGEPLGEIEDAEPREGAGADRLGWLDWFDGGGQPGRRRRRALHRPAHRRGVLAEARRRRRIRRGRARELRHRPGRHEQVPSGRRQLEQRPARLHVLVGQDVVRRPHRGAGDADRGEARLDLQKIVAANPVADQRVRRRAVLQTRGAGGETRVPRRLRRLDGLAEACEGLIAGARDRDPAAVARAIDVGRHHHRRLGAEARRHLTGPRVADHHFLLQPEAHLVEADVDHLPVPAPPRVEDRHQEPARALDRGPGLGQRHRHRHRRAVREAGGELHARERLGDAVVAALGRERPGLAEGRDAQEGEARVAPLELVRREAGRLEASRPQVLDQRVRGGEQGREPRLAREVGRLGLDRELAAVLGLEIERVLAGQRGAALPHRRAGGGLDLDDGGAQIGEQAARHLTGQRVGQLDHQHAGQRATPIAARQPREPRHRGRLTRSRRRAPRCRRAISPSPSP